jgi:hypothetical protein
MLFMQILQNCPTLRSLVIDVLTYFQKRTEYLYIPKLSCAIQENYA